jgi:hypothetical protein
VTRLHTPFALPDELEKAWPTELTAMDPHAGDERLPDPASHEAYAAYARPPLLDAAGHRRWDGEFLERYGQILDGAAPYAAIEPAAEALQVLAPPTHDRRPPHVANEFVPDPTIADFCEDWLPDITLFCGERVFGPYGMGCGRDRLRTAAAVMCFSPLIPPSVRPVTRVCRSSPKPSRSLRGGMIGVLRSPAMLWRVEGERLVPVLPLGERFRPPGPVACLPEGEAVVGRAVQGPDGWWLACGIGLSRLPPAEALMPRLMLELYRLRRHERRYTWEDLLRDRGELLYRSVCEWLWLHDAPPPAPGVA